eukprot:TRINITY_DN155_c0_g1_i1.p1 TRINITY_DN155_c0_g1~~TRINITY_DN155_c0_g1_i1.p1  ORF type:complete len:292 (-),score=45.34 TRINITY_DN155_c0_g1_i1:523-1398(-)
MIVLMVIIIVCSRVSCRQLSQVNITEESIDDDQLLPLDEDISNDLDESDLDDMNSTSFQNLPPEMESELDEQQQQFLQIIPSNTSTNQLTKSTQTETGEQNEDLEEKPQNDSFNIAAPMIEEEEGIVDDDNLSQLLDSTIESNNSSEDLFNESTNADLGEANNSVVPMMEESERSETSDNGSLVLVLSQNTIEVKESSTQQSGDGAHHIDTTKSRLKSMQSQENSVQDQESQDEGSQKSKDSSKLAITLVLVVVVIAAIVVGYVVVRRRKNSVDRAAYQPLTPQIQMTKLD